MIIRNKKEISITKERKTLLDILEKGVEGVLPEKVFKENLFFDKKNRILKVKDLSFDLRKGRVFVIGGGKASGLMAEALEKILGPENITDGIVTCDFTNQRTKKIKVIEAGHPVPDERGLRGVLAMLALKKQYKINERDFVICLLSGGASALMPYPVGDISLEDKKRVTTLLLLSGANIWEINTVRKHLSSIKGGKLGLYFAPAKVISLIISDVVGDNIGVIGSGPTFADKSSFEDVIEVIKKYQLLERIPESVKNFLGKGTREKNEETPEELDNCYNFVLANIKKAIDCSKIEADKRGLKVKILKEISGDPKKRAFEIADDILRGRYKGFNILLFGGETNPKIPEGSGKGGRVQYFVGLSLLAMRGYRKNWTFCGLASDGSDFLFGIGGAIVDKNTLKIIGKKKIKIEEFLEDYNSYEMFLKIENSILKMAHTGTNVGDIFGYFLN